MTETIAYMMLSIVEDLELQERCKNYNDTWENTKISLWMKQQKEKATLFSGKLLKIWQRL